MEKKKGVGPFDEKIPSLRVIGILCWSGPAVLQQQSQFLVLMFDSKHLNIHSLSQCSHCWKLTGGEEKPVAGICKVKMLGSWFYLIKKKNKKKQYTRKAIEMNEWI